MNCAALIVVYEFLLITSGLANLGPGGAGGGGRRGGGGGAVSQKRMMIIIILVPFQCSCRSQYGRASKV